MLCARESGELGRWLHVQQSVMSGISWALHSSVGGTTGRVEAASCSSVTSELKEFTAQQRLDFTSRCTVFCKVCYKCLLTSRGINSIFWICIPSMDISNSFTAGCSGCACGGFFSSFTKNPAFMEWFFLEDFDLVDVFSKWSHLACRSFMEINSVEDMYSRPCELSGKRMDQCWDSRDVPPRLPPCLSGIPTESRAQSGIPLLSRDFGWFWKFFGNRLMDDPIVDHWIINARLKLNQFLLVRDKNPAVAGTVPANCMYITQTLFHIS